jgi:hypothetical protein
MPYVLPLLHMRVPAAVRDWAPHHAD